MVNIFCSSVHVENPSTINSSFGSPNSSWILVMISLEMGFKILEVESSESITRKNGREES